MSQQGFQWLDHADGLLVGRTIPTYEESLCVLARTVYYTCNLQPCREAPLPRTPVDGLSPLTSISSLSPMVPLQILEQSANNALSLHVMNLSSTAEVQVPQTHESLLLDSHFSAETTSLAHTIPRSEVHGIDEDLSDEEWSNEESESSEWEGSADVDMERTATPLEKGKYVEDCATFNTLPEDEMDDATLNELLGLPTGQSHSEHRT